MRFEPSECERAEMGRERWGDRYGGGGARDNDADVGMKYNK